MEQSENDRSWRFCQSCSVVGVYGLWADLELDSLDKLDPCLLRKGVLLLFALSLVCTLIRRGQTQPRTATKEAISRNRTFVTQKTTTTYSFGFFFSLFPSIRSFKENSLRCPYGLSSLRCVHQMQQNNQHDSTRLWQPPCSPVSVVLHRLVMYLLTC